MRRPERAGAAPHVCPPPESLIRKDRLMQPRGCSSSVSRFWSDNLLDELSHVLTQGFTAGPLALPMSIERVGASVLFVTAAEDRNREPERSEMSRTQFYRASLSPNDAHVQNRDSGRTVATI